MSYGIREEYKISFSDEIFKAAMTAGATGATSFISMISVTSAALVLMIFK